MDVTISIKKNATGEVRSYPSTLNADECGDHTMWIWEEGNYACDCNRALFFARASEEDEDWEHPCTDGEYSVNIVASSGENVYSEFGG